jgi:hypothetical protein
MAEERLSWTGVGARFVAALLLVYATFNPEGYSFFHWAVAPIFRGQSSLAGAQLPLKILVGLLLLGGWAVALQVTRRSIGVKGTLLTLAIVAVVVWLLADWHVLNPTSSRAIGHVVLLALALVLTLGMTWSHLSRRLSGQVDTDDIAS